MIESHRYRIGLETTRCLEDAGPLTILLDANDSMQRGFHGAKQNSLRPLTAVLPTRRQGRRLDRREVFLRLNVNSADARVIIRSRIGTGQSILGDTA